MRTSRSALRACGSIVAFLLISACLRAQVAADPVTVPVQFQGLYTSSVATPVTISPLDSSVYISGTGPASSNGAPAGQTTNGLVRLRPGKSYDFKIDQGNLHNIQSIQVKITTVAGYRVFINDVEHEMFEWSPPDATPGYFRVRLDDGGGAAVGESSTPRPGRVLWSVGLGNLRNGKPAGSLMIAEDGLTANTFKPQALFYDRDNGKARGFSGEGEVEIIAPGQVLRQVYTPAVLADISVEAGSDHAYYIRLYPRDNGQILEQDPTTGVYKVSGTPLFEFKIENPTYPSLNALRITKTVYQGPTADTKLTMWTEMRKQTAASGTSIWMVNDWVKQPDGATTATPVSSPVQIRWTYTNSDKDELMEVLDPTLPNTTVRRVFRHYADLSFGPETTRELDYEDVGPETNYVRTSYAYHQSLATAIGGWHRIKSMTSNDGSWTAFDYHDDYWTRGKIKQIRRPFNDAPTADPGSGSTSGDVTNFTYFTLDAFGTKNLNQVDRIVNGTQVGKSVFSYGLEWLDDISTGATVSLPVVVATRKDYFGSGDNDYLTTVVRTYRQDADDQNRFFTNLPHSVIRPDGTATVMAYYRASYVPYDAFNQDPAGGVRVHVVLSGTTEGAVGDLMDAYPNAQPILSNFRIVSGKSSRSLTLMDANSVPKIAQQEVYAKNAYNVNEWSVVRQDWVYYANSLWPNLVQRRTGKTGGFWNVMDRVWTKGRIDSDTDETGIHQTFDYDDLGRVKSVTRDGASYSSGGIDATIAAQTTTNTYDAAGSLVMQVLSGSGTSEAITNRWSYDAAGRILTETAPLPQGRTAQAGYEYSVNVAGRQVKITLPSAAGTTATRIEQRNIAGQVTSIKGSAGVDETYTYNADLNPLKTKASVGLAARTRTVTTDWLGRPIERRMPIFGSVDDFVETLTYEAVGETAAQHRGRVTKVERTGYAPTLYGYDTMSQMNRSGLDVSGGGLQEASSDRIGDSDSFVETYDSAIWLTTEQYAYPYSNDPPAGHTQGEKKLMGRTRKRLTGLDPTLRSEVRSWDADNVLTQRRLEVAGKLVTSKTTCDGFSNTAQELYLNGLLIASTGLDNLTFKRKYDGLGRLTEETDPRTGTTKTSYWPNTAFVQEVIDPSNKRLSRVATYDGAGRATDIQDASNKHTYRSYNVRGQLLYQWGEAVQPVRFTYDDATGERTNLWTYQDKDNLINWEAEIWPGETATHQETRWEYDGPTGLLKKKYDAAGKYVEYTYNRRGQTATRAWARSNGSGANLTTTYIYDDSTGELTDITYNDTLTKPVKYAYTRLGQLAKVWDGTSDRTVLNDTDYRDFYYNPGQPTQLVSVDLPAFYNNGATPRFMKRSYDGIGRSNGFYLGYTGGNADAELAQLLNFNTLGRLDSIDTSRATTTQAHAFQDTSTKRHAYGYLANSSLVETLTAGNFKATRGYESNRDLLTSIEAKWDTSASPTRTKYEYTYNDLGQRSSTRQSGEAFKDYWDGVTGYQDPVRSYPSILRVHTYNDRGELESSAVYKGTGLLPTPASALELPGRRFEYRYDRAGNRKLAGPTGSATLPSGASSSDDEYHINNLNQYDWKENNTVRVLGTADAGATVAAQSTGTSDPQATATGAPVTVLSKDRAYAADISPDNNGHRGSGVLSVYAATAASAGANTMSRQQRNWSVPPHQQFLNYDADGNLTDDGFRSYTYDAENRLVKMEIYDIAVNYGNPSLALDFTYDYLGRRVEKKVTNRAASNTVISCRRYLYDGWDLVAEIAGPGDRDQNQNPVTAGTLLRSYTWGLDIASSLGATGGVGGLIQIADHVTGRVFVPTYDGNGNVASLVNGDNGALAAVYEYGPFGEALRSEVFDSVMADQPFRFSTKFLDTETGLTYYGARYYSADMGRFINRDPIGENGGINLYGFCGNDAINHFDYLGYSWLSKAFHRLGQWFTANPIITTVIGVALNFVPGVGPALSLAWNAGVGLTTGGVKGMLIGMGGSLIGGGIGGKLGGALVKQLGLEGLGAAIAKGFTTGAFAGAVGSLVTGGNPLTGALIGGISGAVISGGMHSIEHGAFGPGVQRTYQTATDWARDIGNRIRGWFSRDLPEENIKIGTPYVVDEGQPAGLQLARSPLSFGGLIPENIPNDYYGLAKDGRGQLYAVSPRNGRMIKIPADAVEDFTRLHPAEVDTMIRVRQQLGLELRDSPHEGAEYIDSKGRSYDQMGSPENARNWDAKAFERSIIKHLNKSNDFTIIDLTGYSPAQQAAVGGFLRSLPRDSQFRIIPVGFSP